MTGDTEILNYTQTVFYEHVSETNYSSNGTDFLYDVPTAMIVLLSFLYGSISVLAVVGNLLVMWVVATAKRMQNVTNCFISNLALADIVIALFAIPFQFQAALLQRWILPDFMCPFCPFVQALSVNVSVFTLTAIALDRHRAIITPLNAHTSKKAAKVVILVIWVLAILFASPMAITWRVSYISISDDSNDKHRFCEQNRVDSFYVLTYRLVLYIVQYIIPLSVITCAYTRMVLALWGARAPGNAQQARDASQMRNKKKVIKMLILVVALFTFCWLPLQTYYLLCSYFDSINEYRYINIIFFCFDWLAMSNACYNPFIYAIYNEKFKTEFKQRYSCWARRSRNAADSTDDGYSSRGRTSVMSRSDRASLQYRQSHQPITAARLSIKNGVCNVNLESKEPLAIDMESYSLQKGLGKKSNAVRWPSNPYIADRDEAITEVYVFPNSHVVEFTDNRGLCDEKV